MANLAAGTQAGGLCAQLAISLCSESNLATLEYCTAFSCFFAAARVLNVPRFLRLPVFAFFFREYKR